MSEETTGYFVFKDDGAKLGDLQRAFVSFFSEVTHAANAVVVGLGLLGTTSVVMAFKSAIEPSQITTMLDLSLSFFIGATVIHFLLIYHSLYEIEKKIKQQDGLEQCKKDKWLKSRPEVVIRIAGTIMLLLFAGKTGVEKLFPPNELVYCIFAAIMFLLFIVWSSVSLILNRKPKEYDPNVIGYLTCDICAAAIWISIGLYFMLPNENGVSIEEIDHISKIQKLSFAYCLFLMIFRLGIGASICRLLQKLGNTDVTWAQAKNIGIAFACSIVFALICNIYGYYYLSTYNAKTMKDLATACPKLEKMCSN
jgi:hypothetical protein